MERPSGSWKRSRTGSAHCSPASCRGPAVNPALSSLTGRRRSTCPKTRRNGLSEAELPEVKREDVKVTVEKGMLRITGERKLEKEEKDKKYHRIERAYGSFERTFVLPEDAKADAVAAEFKEGVLKVHLPKSEQAKPKSLEIKVS